MAARKILPIAEPDITSYAHFAFFLSVLYTDTDSLRWVYNHFVQLFMRGSLDGSLMVDYYTNNPDDHHYIPSLAGSPRLARKMIQRCFPRFADFVRSAIEDGYYVTTFVNDFYIPGTVAYQNRSNPHSIFLYGFDDESRTFQATAFLSNQRYGVTSVGYEDLERAFHGFEPADEFHYTAYTHLYKLNERRKSSCEFHVGWLMKQLEDYRHAAPSNRVKERFEVENSPPLVWGMEIYDCLLRQIERHVAREINLDHRPFYVLWEHKRMMNRRFAYMERQGYYVVSPEAAEGYRNVEQSALVTRNLILKYWMTLDNRYLEQLAERLIRLKDEEAVAIERLLDEYGTSHRMGGM
ncbi:hypothetical protein GE107_05150 [Cohnella sp. CFH 77786]|uniref:hypothetical protein n=1 Tax=Cohnella sp. CFH 77786 TaxID=2662265 RepID=UPI001C60D433|nr:hypothetical protein [Cohnella sp. CFH 77786]MBW5445447.1 hypothetical protein [Cohnella sp. CFH 77786]